MTSLQQGSSYLKWRIESLFGSGDDSIRGIFAKIKHFYTTLDEMNESDEGEPYPDPLDDDKGGMSIELRWV
jgi:hypothetical protein